MEGSSKGSAVRPFSDYSEARFPLRSTISEADIDKPKPRKPVTYEWPTLIRCLARKERHRFISELADEPAELRIIGIGSEVDKLKSGYRALAEVIRLRNGRKLSTYVEFGIEGGLEAIAQDLLRQNGSAELESVREALALPHVTPSQF